MNKNVILWAVIHGVSISAGMLGLFLLNPYLGALGMGGFFATLAIALSEDLL